MPKLENPRSGRRESGQEQNRLLQSKYDGSVSARSGGLPDCVFFR